MIVFVVIKHFVESDEVVRVFSTREKAEVFIAAHRDDPEICFPSNIVIEEYALD